MNSPILSMICFDVTEIPLFLPVSWGRWKKKKKLVDNSRKEKQHWNEWK